MDLSISPAPYEVKTGSYVGDASSNKAIAHSCGVIPKFIIVYAISYNYLITRQGQISKFDNTALTMLGCTVPDATNFYVGNATNYANSANANGTTYYFTAIP